MSVDVCTFSFLQSSICFFTWSCVTFFDYENIKQNHVQTAPAADTVSKSWKSFISPSSPTGFKFEFGTRHRDHTVDRLFSGFLQRYGMPVRVVRHRTAFVGGATIGPQQVRRQARASVGREKTMRTTAVGRRRQSNGRRTGYDTATGSEIYARLGLFSFSFLNRRCVLTE